MRNMTAKCMSKASKNRIPLERVNTELKRILRLLEEANQNFNFGGRRV